jgi:hypothetical protein
MPSAVRKRDPTRSSDARARNRRTPRPLGRAELCKRPSNRLPVESKHVAILRVDPQPATDLVIRLDVDEGDRSTGAHLGENANRRSRASRKIHRALRDGASGLKARALEAALHLKSGDWPAALGLLPKRRTPRTGPEQGRPRYFRKNWLA